MDKTVSGLHARLPRLTDASYQGRVAVHWSMTLHDRSTGWLTASHHSAVRELLIHAGHRYDVACPVYCLMPDHAHFLWVGLSEQADQRRAAAWFRRGWNALLAPHHALQRQAHDHVLRAEERRQDAFVTIADYILRNPERAGLVSVWRDWEFIGAVFPGVYPLDPREESYWEKFWRAYTRRVDG